MRERTTVCAVIHAHFTPLLDGQFGQHDTIIHLTHELQYKTYRIISFTGPRKERLQQFKHYSHEGSQQVKNK
jgi:hypothetical protein